MTIWNTASIEDNPEVCLISWQIMEIDDGTRYFVGYNILGEGRVSSAIKTFDEEHMIGQTVSGRVYKLEGPPGRNRDAEYVWACWLNINSIKEYKVITKEVIK